MGNTSCVLTLQARPLRDSGTAVLLRALAITDSVCLGVGLLHLWLCELASWDIRKMSDVSCRLHVFFTYLSVHVSAWTLVLLTAERLICVTKPMEASRLCSKSRLWISWCVSVVLLATVNAWFHLAGTRLVRTIQVAADNSTLELTSCDLAGDQGSWLRESRVWGDLLLSCLLPAVFILPANAVLMWRILVLAKKRRAMQQRSNNRRNKASAKSQGITLMLVMACLMFLLTTLPINIYMLYQQYGNKPSGFVAVARGELTYTIFSLIYYVNNAVNFLIYFLSGPVFRSAAKEVFCSNRCTSKSPTLRHTSSRAM